MTDASLPPVARIAALTCAVAALAAIAAAGVWMAFARGPFIDEFSSLWMSEPGVPLRRMLVERLAFDVHPPFYMLATRGLRELWPGAGLAELRLFNLAPLAVWALYAAWAYARRPGLRAFVAAAFVLSLAGEEFGGQMRSLRPYFALICAADVFALASALIYLDLRAGRRAARVEIVVASAALLTLMSGHYLSAFETALLVCAFAAALAITGDRRSALLALVAVAVAAIPSLAFLAWRRGYMLGWTGGGFWIRTSTIEALRIMGHFLTRMAGFNIVAYAGLALMARPSTSHRRAGEPMGELAAIGSGSVVLTLAILLVVNLQTSIVIERYLDFMGGALAVALAAGVARWATTRPWLYAAALAWAAAAAGMEARSHITAHEDAWYATARLVAADVKACPGARVDTFHWSDRYFNALPGDPYARAYAYSRLARQFGFADALQRPLPQTDPGCPRILWGEHLGAALGLPDGTAILQKLMTGRNPIPQAFIRPDLQVQRGETGYVLLAPPKAHP